MKKIIDLHQDILLHQRSPSVYKYQNQTSLNQVLASDIQIVFGTGFVFGEDDNIFDPNCLNLIEKDIDEYIRYEKNNENFLIIKNKDDLEKVDGQAGKITGLIIHIEGLNTFTDCIEDWARLETFYEKGLRSIGIVWTKKNSLGGGDSSDECEGLSDLGKRVLSWAISKGILIDFSHMNERTFFDVTVLLAEDNSPIFISHGNARAVCGNKRNYTDQQLEMVRKSGQ
jgi:membrane dipeptidase